VRTLRRLLAGLLLILAPIVLVGVIVTEGLLHPFRREPGAEARRRAVKIAAAAGARLEDAEVTAADKAVLRGWFFRLGRSSGRAVILLHGQADNRAGMLGFVPFLLARGYDVLAIDSRAQGESGGKIATYGIRETGDLNRWIEWLTTERGERRLYGLGESMGAAILLQAVGQGAPFRAAVAESSFSSLRQAAYYRLGAQLGGGEGLGRTLLRPIVESGLLYARLRYGLKLASVSPAAAVAKTDVPILLIHGVEDHNIPPWHSRRILEQHHGRVEFWEPPRTGHVQAFGRWPNEFVRRVSGWFASAR
jgi:fermentation-respiration switch protein FrsA (DUF1100 family)